MLPFFLASAAEPEPHFQPPPGLKAELFAAEPMFSNPVAVSADADGSVYVAETRRRKANRLDIRRNADWLNASLSFTNVAQREAFLRDQFTAENSELNRQRVQDYNRDGVHDWQDLMFLTDTIHKLSDTDGDRKADRATRFAEGFNTVVTDIAGGVLARGKNVYATIAPDLWRLTDTDGDGIADERESLAQGFGVQIAYAGHNMHGITMGPDGRLYWSIGDMGSDYHPNEGALFRCDPDGSNFEVFARGLRNPQEFVFNEYGDIFTGDNDSDKGDRERWYHVVEGGDYGWRNWWQYQVGEQWGSNPDTYFLWTEERVWHEWTPEQGAWHLPPAALIADGPCGMTIYPGTGMGERYRGHMFLVHFTGSPNNSGIWDYTVQQDGATYTLDRNEPWLTGMVPTGIDFSPDGSELFIADWSGGWDLNDQGRVWRLFDARHIDTEATRTTRQLLREGMESRPQSELLELLRHDNMNVRREAQFALAAKGNASVDALTALAKDGSHQLARIHALWGLGQLQRQTDEGNLQPLVALLNDDDPEIRAQTAKVLGDARHESAADTLTARLSDPSYRVQFHSAMALGKLGHDEAIPALFEMLARNGKDDKYLRHAGIEALHRIGNEQDLSAATGHPSPDVRLASVVALRRMHSSEVKHFLSDSNELVVIEAARAINDVPIEEGFEPLAQLAESDLYNEWLARRALNANFRLGAAEHASRLARFAADARQLEPMRLEALRMLADWESPNPRDRVVNAWRPLPPREMTAVRKALEPHILQILNGPESLRAEATRLARDAGLELNGGMLADWVQDPKRSTATRVAALNLLAERNPAELDRVLGTALNASSVEPELYAAGLSIQAARNPESAGRELLFPLRYRLYPQVQAGLRALEGLESTNFVMFLQPLADDLAAGKAPEELALDIYNAAQSVDDLELQTTLGSFQSKLESRDLGAASLAAQGGNARNGRRVFFEKGELQCLRCHKVTFEGELIGGEAGPNLTGIGENRSREELIRSIVDPNAAFAEGFEQAVLILRDGTAHAGRVVEETGDRIVLEVPAGDEEDFEEMASAGTAIRTVTVNKSDIETRQRGLSAMPEGLGQLMTLFELRDLVAFLAEQ